MRMISYVVALVVVSGGVAWAQEPYPPQPPPQYPQQQYAPPPQYGQPPPPAYAQPAPNPLQDPVRLARWEHLRHRSHSLRVGGKVLLGIGIPFFLIGMSVGIVAVYNNGIYLCSGISCNDAAAAGVGFTMAVLGAGMMAGGIVMLIVGNSDYERSERLRLGMEAVKYVPRVAPLARLDGHGVDGVAAAWGFSF